MKNKCLMTALVLCSLLAAACASVSAVDEKPAPAGSAPVVYPDYAGEKTPLAVLPMGLSQQAAKRYPHLMESSVGMGVHNMLTDALYRTKRFRFVEQDENVVKEVFRKQWLAASGAVDQSSAVELGKVLGAKKVIYGEVYDYSEGKSETITGVRKSVTPRVRVGIQVRLVDVETLEYVPASGTAYGADWGEAAQKAVETAVEKLICQLPN